MTSLAGSTSRDDWCTPPEVLARVRRVGPIVLDPCSTHDNPTAAAEWLYPGKRNGLLVSWLSGLAYMNPPYGGVAAWAEKAAHEASLGCEIVSLVAARTETRWFFRMAWNTAQAICFWRGRLRFVGAESCAPFPSAVVYHGPRPWLFEGAFADVGRVVRLLPASRS